MRSLLSGGSLLALTSLLSAGCQRSSGDIYAPTDTVRDPVNGTRAVVHRHLKVVGDYQLAEVELPPLWNCPSEATATPTPESDAAIASAAESDATKNLELAPMGCNDFAAFGRRVARQVYEAKLDDQRSDFIEKYCKPQLASWCLNADGLRVDSYYCQDRSERLEYENRSGSSRGASGAASYGSSRPIEVESSESDSAEGATSYSTTNTQVASVDEADWVKTDGRSVFVLTNAGVRVFDAWPAEQAHEIALIPIEGAPRRMFLDDGRLVVYAQANAGRSSPSARGCTYGYDCRFSAEPGPTHLTVFDVADPANPKTMRKWTFPGDYVSSRRIGKTVYSVVNDQGAALPSIHSGIAQPATYAELEESVAARKAQIGSDLDAVADAYFLPKSSPGAASEPLAECPRLYTTRQLATTSFTTIVALDLTTLAPPTRTVLATPPGYVYASADALYLAVDARSANTSTKRPATELTVVHKFGLSGTDTTHVGSAVVTGHVLNQFAMDEYEGVLRIATTTGRVPDPNVSSSLTTLGRTPAAPFTRLASVDGIAKTEDIRSVRFDGDRGYVVTFKKTDPLFVFDLADPYAPKITGELKIPGFSTYMHPLDRNHILAVGFDADDQGSFAYFDGIQIQIFDVTDMAQPSLMYKHVVGTRGSGSEALLDHLAFNYFAPKGMLAMPMTICEGGDNGVYGDSMTFSGLMVFDVSLTTGIAEHGRLPFVKPSSSPAASCGTWWSSSSSLVKRSMFLDDYMFAISDAEVRIAHLDTLATPLRTLSLQGTTGTIAVEP